MAPGRNLHFETHLESLAAVNQSVAGGLCDFQAFCRNASDICFASDQVADRESTPEILFRGG